MLDVLILYLRLSMMVSIPADKSLSLSILPENLSVIRLLNAVISSASFSAHILYGDS